MDDLFIEFKKHSSEDDGDGQPLKWVHIVVEYKNADDDCQYFPGGGDQGEYVLLEVGNDVIDADLADHLKDSDSYDVPEGTGVVYHEMEAFEEGALNDGEGWADDEAEEVGGGEELVCGGFECSFGVGLGVWEEGIHHHWYTQQKVAQPLLTCVMFIPLILSIFCEVEQQNSYSYD